MKILLCDDSMTVRKKMGNLLQSLIQCNIYEATNGDEAIQSYQDLHPDLVFMDIMMPQKDGIEAVKGIIAKDPSAKIIMLSSVGTKNNLQEALKAGALDFVQKPCEEARLKIILDTYRKEA